MFVPLPLTPWAGGHFAEAVLQKTIFGFCIPSNEGKWSTSFRNNQVLNPLHQDLGVRVQLYFTVGVMGASPTLRPKVNPGCVGGSFKGGRAGNQESHSHFFCCSFSIAFGSGSSGFNSMVQAALGLGTLQ